MSSISDIYKALTAAGYSTEVSIDEIVQRRCQHRSVLQMLGEKTERVDPTRQLLQAAAAEMCKTIQRYFKESARHFPDREDLVFHPTIPNYYRGVMPLNHIGKLGDRSVSVYLLPEGRILAGTPPGWIRLAAATSAYLTECSRALVVTVDRNNLRWRFWHIEGDFEAAAQPVLDEADAILDFAESHASKEGAAVECDLCPYTKTCEVQKVNRRIPHEAKLTAIVDQEVPKYLDAYLESLNTNPRKKRRTNCIHPSEFSTSSCDRKIAYSLLGEKKVGLIAPALYRIFDMGHAIHDVVQRLLSDAYDDFEAEVTVQHESIKLYGHCDGARSNGRGYEIKSISRKGHDGLKEPKKEHVAQATLYGVPLGLKEVEYLYVNKETGVISSYTVDVNRGTWHRQAARAERIIATVEKGELPDRVEKKYLCDGCHYRWKCRPPKNNLQASFR